MDNRYSCNPAPKWAVVISFAVFFPTLFFVPPLFSLLFAIYCISASRLAFYSITIESTHIHINRFMSKSKYRKDDLQKVGQSYSGTAQQVHMYFSDTRKYSFLAPGNVEEFIADMDAIVRENNRSKQQSKQWLP